MTNAAFPPNNDDNQPGDLPEKWDDSFMDSLNKRIGGKEGVSGSKEDGVSKPPTQMFQDFSVYGLADPVFAPIRNLIPPPADNPDYNRPASPEFNGSVDIYLETRKLLTENKVEPSVIVPVKEVFRNWQEKLAQGIEQELKQQGTALDDEKLAEIADLGRALATKGITTIQERTLSDNLDAAWVPARPVVAPESLIENDHIGGIVYAGIYDASLKQATEVKLLKLSNSDGSNNDAIPAAEKQLFLTYTALMVPSMQARDEQKRASLAEEKANINRYADQDVAKDEIALAKAQIGLLNSEIADAWTSEERQQKQTALSELQFTRKELQGFNDDPASLADAAKAAASTLGWYAERQAKGETVDQADVVRLRGRQAWLNKLQEPGALETAVADYDSKLAMATAEFSLQPEPTAISANKEKIGKLNTRIDVITQYADEVQRNHAVKEIDFAISVIDERLGLPNQMARELPTLRTQQQQADQGGDFDRYVAVTNRIEMWEQVTKQIADQQAESDEDLLAHHNADIATKAGSHRHVMVSAGTVIDSAFITMLSDAGMSKSTIKWGAELLVEAIQETPKFAPRAGFPIDGLRPAEDAIPANRLGEIFTASRNLPWQDSPVTDALPKNGNKFVNLDDAMIEATKVLSEPQGDKAEDEKRLALGVFLNRNTYAVRRVVDRWVQDGNVPALRDDRIDPASEMILGYHVQAKDVLRAVDAVFAEGVTSNKISYNPAYLKDGQREAILGSNSYALKPESVELMKDSLTTAIRRMGATQAVDLENQETLVPVVPKYKKGAEILFAPRLDTAKTSEPASEILPPVNDNAPITVTVNISPAFLASGGTVHIDATQGKDGPAVHVDVLSRDDVLAYRKRKEDQAQKPTPKMNMGM